MLLKLICLLAAIAVFAVPAWLVIRAWGRGEAPDLGGSADAMMGERDG